MSRRGAAVRLIDVTANRVAQASARDARSAVIAEQQAQRERAAAAAQRARQRAKRVAQAPAPVQSVSPRPAPAERPAVETVTVTKLEYSALMKAANHLLKKF
ncbi:hypothetical protein [Microbacterium sp.]|uniref:hypothetical protein n=1 Tax=Microbacterium sp. TaxID=51671 RepID=UPI0033400EE5